MIALGALNAQPALSVMKLMTSQQQRQGQNDNAMALGLGDAGHAQTAERVEASDEFYFGTQMTVTKLMFLMMEGIAGYLNDKLEGGRNGDDAAVEEGNKWRKQALAEDIPVGSEKDFTIPEPGKDGVTFRETANVIRRKFNMSFLARDRGLTDLLEKLTGFGLHGIDAADIIEAFAEPDGDAARKVRHVLEEGLAGQEGSKVSQRLDRAAEGPQSVADVLSSQRSDADVVDEETLKEEQKALEVARMNERLDEVREMQDAIAEAVEHSRGREGQADPEAAQRAIDAAMDIIQRLSDDAEADDLPEADAETETATDVSDSERSEADAAYEADGELAKLEAETDRTETAKASYAALAEAYADEANGLGERDDEERDGLRFAI